MEIPKIEIDQSRFKRSDIIDGAKQLLKDSSNHELNIQTLSSKHKIDQEKVKAYYLEAMSLMKDSISTFWEVQIDSKMKVKSVDLVRIKFRDWLVSKGVFRLPLNLKDDTYVQITDNIVEEINRKKIKKLVIDYIQTLPDRFDLITRDKLEEFVIRGANVYFSRDFLDFLPELEEGNLINGKKFKWNRDTQTHSFFYYKNNIVIVDKDGFKKIPYSNLYNFIWKTQIIDREFNPNDKDCDYKDFIWKISGQNDEKFAFVKSIIGYLLHSHKDKSKLWSIVLNDEDVTDEANGGNGKGLFFQGINKLAEVLIIDGKNFTFDKSFVFQRVKHSTQILFFDDVGRNFDFEKLFSVISEGISIERKGKDEFYISFEYSPKVGISTNYAIQTTGNSVERRKIDVEFSNYFSTEKTPMEEYGKIMFDEWSKAEWSAFDSFMMDCQMYYFKNGITRPETNNNAKRELYNTTPKGFPEFIESYETNERHDKKELAKEFSDLQSFKFGTSTVMRYVKAYCKYMGYDYQDGHSGKLYWFSMISKDIKQKEESDYIPF